MVSKDEHSAADEEKIASDLRLQIANFLRVFEGEEVSDAFTELVFQIRKHKADLDTFLTLGGLALDTGRSSLLSFYHIFESFKRDLNDKNSLLGIVALAVRESKKNGINYITTKGFYNKNIVEPIQAASSKIRAELIAIGETSLIGEAGTATEAPTAAKPDWETRPQERHGWKPEDYILYAISELKPADEAGFEGDIKLRGEFNRFVQEHPEYRQYESYWRTALANWSVLYKADPSSGTGGFTIDFKAYLERGFQQGGFDVTHVHDILRDKKFGNLAMRVMALLELCLFDNGKNNFEYRLKHNLTTIGPVNDIAAAIAAENLKPEKDRRKIELLKDKEEKDLVIGKVIVKKGQFVARNMDGNESNLNEAVNLIAKDQGWQSREKNKGTNDAENHLIDNIVSHAFRIANAVDMRGHYFLDDAAAAVTKGFGGEDYTWMSSPQATIGYDMNRYGREPKASYYLLSVVDLPDEWHKQTAHNTFFRSTGEILTGNDDLRAVIRRTKQLTDVQQAELMTLYEKASASRATATETDTIKRYFTILEKYAAESRIKAGRERTDSIRSWFEGFLSEEDVRACLKKSLEPAMSVSKYSQPIEKDGDQYQFVPKGSTFPTLYDFYVGQMMRGGKPKDGNVVTAAMGDQSQKEAIIFDDAQFQAYADTNFRNPEKKDKKGFKMYLTAREGWLKAMDMIKEPVRPTSGKEILLKFDEFTGALGKAKIIDGAHHNMMNVLGLLFLVKMFKYLEPRSYADYQRFKNQVLKKVQDQDTSQSGGGIPPQVKEYLSWLLSEAKSTQRIQDGKGDLLRPMDPSHHEKQTQEVELETRGMERGFSKSLRTWLIELEHGLGEIGEGHDKKEGASDIPPGPIQWDKQNDSVKGV